MDHGVTDSFAENVDLSLQLPVLDHMLLSQQQSHTRSKEKRALNINDDKINCRIPNPYQEK